MIEIELGKMLEGSGGKLQMEVQTAIERGSFVALFGPSGSGKTTILRMLAGLMEPDIGRIIVDGETWFDSGRRISIPPQQRSIGFVFQDYALFPNLTVRQNVAYAVGKADMRWVDELLNLTSLTGLQQRFPDMLSGGQRQRVALARALARRPRLLLLDEPLSALDPSLRIQLQDDLARLHRRLNLTTLLVSHDIGEVFKLSQRVLQLDAGRLVQSGSPSELFLRRMSGKLNLHAQVLTIRSEEVVRIVSLLIGQDIIDVIASDDEVKDLRSGDFVSVSSKAISPFLFKNR